MTALPPLPDRSPRPWRIRCSYPLEARRRKASITASGYFLETNCPCAALASWLLAPSATALHAARIFNRGNHTKVEEIRVEDRVPRRPCGPGLKSAARI